MKTKTHQFTTFDEFATYATKHGDIWTVDYILDTCFSLVARNPANAQSLFVYGNSRHNELLLASNRNKCTDNTIFVVDRNDVKNPLDTAMNVYGLTCVADMIHDGVFDRYKGK